MSEPYQKRVLDSFNRKEVRILVTTALMEVGLDVQTNAVLALSGCLTLGSLLQWLGRGGRSGEASIGIACFADWMREENSLDLFGDAEYGGKKAMAPSVLSERRAKRAKADTALVQFANSAPDCAHKIVVETYGGSTFSPLADCCSACFPDQSHYEVNGQWEAQDRVEAARTHQISRLNTDDQALNKEELVSATLQLNNWKVKRWAEKLGSRRSIFGPVQLLPNVDLKRLAEKLPLVTTFERFSCVMEGWKSLEEEGDQLWKCAQQIMDSIVTEREKDKAVKAAATAKKQASKKKKNPSESPEVTARVNPNLPEANVVGTLHPPLSSAPLAESSGAGLKDKTNQPTSRGKKQGQKTSSPSPERASTSRKKQRRPGRDQEEYEPDDDHLGPVIRGQTRSGRAPKLSARARGHL